MYNPIKQFNFADSGRLPKDIEFARESPGICYNSQRQLVRAENNLPLFGYDVVTGTPLGLVIQEVSANINRNSNDLTSSSYIRTNLGVTKNAALGPDGRTSASRITEDTATGQHYISSNAVDTVVIGDIIQITFWAKAETRSSLLVSMNPAMFGGVPQQGVFNLATGIATAIGTTTCWMKACPDSWYECRFVTPAVTVGTALSLINIYLATGPGTTNYTGDGTSGCLLYQIDNRLSSAVTGPVVTYKYGDVRQADYAKIPNSIFKTFWNPSEFTISLTGKSDNSSATSRFFFSINDGTINNSITIRLLSGVLYFTITVAGVQVGNVALGSYTPGDTVYIGVSVSGATITTSINGSVPSTSTTTSSTLLPTVTQWELGSFLAQGAVGTINGSIAKLTYWDKALPQIVQEISQII